MPALQPPRPVAPGDVVAGFSDELGGWTAAQVTRLNAQWRTVDLLELDWSGPEPSTVADLGPLAPLRLTHHAHRGRLSHCNFHWLVPRSCKVLGPAPLLVEQPSNSFGGGWHLGLQLDLQRRWDRGDQGTDPPGLVTVQAPDLEQVQSDPEGIWALTVRGVDELDCRVIVRSFPGLRRLTLDGALGTLHHAAALQELTALRYLALQNLFGMTAADRPDPRALTRLDALYLHSVPAEFAAAVRKAWTPEIAHGTHLEVTGARKPHWVSENRDNPLREWDGREQISPARYRKAVAQYRATRAAVLAALSEGAQSPQALEAIGREFGTAFNRLEGTRSPFIDTEERYELFDALRATVAFAEAQLGRAFPDAVDHLFAGLEPVRDW